MTNPLDALSSFGGLLPFLLTMLMSSGLGVGEGVQGSPLLGQAFSYLSITLLFQYASQAYGLVREVLQGQTTTAVLRENDPAYSWVRTWLAKEVKRQRDQPVSWWAEVLEAVHPTGSALPRQLELTTVDAEDVFDDDNFTTDGYETGIRRDRRDEDLGAATKLRVYPGHDVPITIRWRGISYTFTTTASDKKDDEWDMIKISTQSRSRDAFDAIIMEARRRHKSRKDARLDVHVSRGGEGWQHTMSRSTRPWDSLILPQSTKSALLDDCREFLEAKKFYAARGLPFRRGYLLYGCPGSGKSTTIAAIATELKLDVYIVNLNTKRLNDGTLHGLLSELPAESILVMEDIDCAMPSRVDEADGKTGKKNGKQQGGTSGVSLSGLLNAIDGIASAEGRLLFCTTNYLYRIDPALARPGECRCDVWFEFTHADSEQVVAAFKHFYLPAPSTAERAARTEDAPDPEADKACLERERQIDELALLFAVKVEKELLTIAQLQGFFLRYRNKPVEVVEAVDAWIASGFEQGAARIVPADPRLAVAPLQAITSRAQSQAGEPFNQTRGQEEDETEGGVSDEAEGGGEDEEDSDRDAEIDGEDDEA